MTLIQAKSQELCFHHLLLFFYWTLFLDTPKKTIFKSDGRYLIFCESFPSELIFFCTFYSKNRPFFHLNSKRWKLWGKIYWKLHFLVFPYFLFLQIFSEDIKKEGNSCRIFFGIFRLDGIFNHVFWETFDLLRSFLWYSFSVWIGRD